MKTKKDEVKRELPLTVQEAATLWEVNPSRVKQFVKEGRVKYKSIGGGDIRAGALLIMQLERPERLPPGALKKHKKKTS